MSLQERSFDNRERYRCAIRSDQHDKMLRERRKVIVAVSDNSFLLQLYQNLGQVNNLTSYLEVLCCQLQRDIAPEMWPLLEGFHTFALQQIDLENSNVLLLVELIVLTCYDDLPNINKLAEQTVKVFLKYMFSEDEEMRYICTLGITNLSYCKKAGVVDVMLANSVPEKISQLLVRYQVTEGEMENMVEFVSNVIVAEKKQLKPIIYILELISSRSTSKSVLQHLTTLCSHLIDQVEPEYTLGSPTYQSIIFHLLISFQTCRDPYSIVLLRKIYTQADSKLKLELLQRGMMQLIVYALSQRQCKVKKAAMALLYECLAEDCVGYIAHPDEMSLYLGLLLRCFVEESSLRFEVLRVLNRGVSNTPLMTEQLIDSEHFFQVLQEFDPAELDCQTVHNLLQLLERLLKFQPNKYLRIQIERICEITYKHPNSNIAELSEQLLHRIVHQ